MPHFGPNRSFPATRSCCTRTAVSRTAVSIALPSHRKETSRRHEQAENPRPSTKGTIRSPSEHRKVAKFPVGMRRSLTLALGSRRSDFRAEQCQSFDLGHVDTCESSTFSRVPTMPNRRRPQLRSVRSALSMTGISMSVGAGGKVPPPTSPRHPDRTRPLLLSGQKPGRSFAIHAQRWRILSDRVQNLH